MFNFLKKKSVEDGICVPYKADKESQLRIKKFLENCGLSDFSFGIILFKLGFDPKKIVYLKKDDLLAGTIYYSLESDKFNKKDKVFSHHPCYIDLICGEYRKSYLICRDKTNKNEIYLENRDVSIEKNIDGEFYRCDRRDGYVDIYVRKIDGSEIRFNCYQYYDIDYGELTSIDEALLEQYMLNLKKTDSLKEAFEMICQLIRIDGIDYRMISLGFYENGELQLGYSVEGKYKSCCREIVQTPFIKDHKVTRYEYVSESRIDIDDDKRDTMQEIFVEAKGAKVRTRKMFDNTKKGSN